MSRTKLLLDGAVAALALAGTLAQLHHGTITADGVPGRIDLTGVLLAVCSTAPLVGWRRSPIVVFVVTAGSSAVLAALGYPVDLIPGPTVALYLLVSTGRRATTVVLVMLAAYLVSAGIARGTFPGIELLHTSLAWSVAWFAGERTRLRTEQLTELRRRAEHDRQLAVAEERARIARDLHDTAGHAINVIAVRAGAARLRHDPDRSDAALRVIEDLARQTAEDIDRTIGGLRDRVPVGLASLGSLIEQHSVSVETVGASRPLSAAVDQAAYRILQEALTNASRHGAGNAAVQIAYGDRSLDLTITNPTTPGTTPDPGTTPGTDAARGGGHGLIGMKERAAMVGGDVEACRVGDTFRVHARLPYGDRP